MRIRWTPAAAADLQNISDYLRQHHPHYREPTMRNLYDTIRSLRQSPYRGRPGSEGGTREIVSLPCRMSPSTVSMSGICCK
jgi:plasmid stabilization system protein ParE